jgi:hypothetical protein
VRINGKASGWDGAAAVKWVDDYSQVGIRMMQKYRQTRHDGRMCLIALGESEDLKAVYVSLTCMCDQLHDAKFELPGGRTGEPNKGRKPKKLVVWMPVFCGKTVGGSQLR